MMTKLIIWEYFKRTRLLFLVKENGKFFFKAKSNNLQLNYFKKYWKHKNQRMIYYCS